MKTQLKKELHAKNGTEIATQLKEAREALRVLRLDQEMGKLKNTSSLSQKKVEIAVMQTILNEKLAAEVKANEERIKEQKEGNVKSVSTSVLVDKKPSQKSQGKGGKK